LPHKKFNLNMENKETVLVTGGSGFIASYCLIALLKSGYKVRATLRSLKKSELVKQMLKEGGVRSLEDLSFVEADLANEFSWEKAVKDCQYVIHIASPTPLTGLKPMTISLSRPKTACCSCCGRPKKQA
jgi:dihydroflavonol-4-reductase